jgi:hypothetical protein
MTEGLTISRGLTITAGFALRFIFHTGRPRRVGVRWRGAPARPKDPSQNLWVPGYVNTLASSLLNKDNEGVGAGPPVPGEALREFQSSSWGTLLTFAI